MAMGGSKKIPWIVLGMAVDVFCQGFTNVCNEGRDSDSRLRIASRLKSNPSPSYK